MVSHRNLEWDYILPLIILHMYHLNMFEWGQYLVCTDVAPYSMAVEWADQHNYYRETQNIKQNK